MERQTETVRIRFVRTPENTQKFRVDPWVLDWEKAT